MHYAKWQTTMTSLLYHQSPGTFANDLAFHCVEEKRNQSTESSGVFFGFFPCASIFRNARTNTLVVKNAFAKI